MRRSDSHAVATNHAKTYGIGGRQHAHDRFSAVEGERHLHEARAPTSFNALQQALFGMYHTRYTRRRRVCFVSLSAYCQICICFLYLPPFRDGVVTLLEKQPAPGVVLFHEALEGLLVGQLVVLQVKMSQGSELAQLGRDAA